MKFFTVGAIFSGAVAATLLLSSCSATVVLEPAADSNNPACAEVTVRLPEVIGDLPKRSTNAQATGAWGDPVGVIVRCGLAPAEVSDLPCVSAGGVDWLVDESESPNYRFISYGSNPATEVIVNSSAVSGVSALDAVGPAVSSIAATKKCN